MRLYAEIEFYMHVLAAFSVPNVVNSLRGAMNVLMSEGALVLLDADGLGTSLCHAAKS